MDPTMLIEVRREEEFYMRALAHCAPDLDSPPNRALIVGHYQESLDWLRYIASSVKVYVYEKFYDVPGNVKLPNIGMESHSYLYHVVRHYDDLHEVNFFMQGCPLDRSNGVCAGINFLSHFDFVEFGSDLLDTGPGPRSLSMQRLYLHLFGERCPEAWVFRACQLLGVSRKRIRNRPVEFYDRLRRYCEEGWEDIEGKKMPYYIEQLWWKIMGP